ncbi:hypothetical protein [Intrasporangium sp.]|uniref:hypothetical protein n=1 Tax=Intrasporangium sp. TaxID=1925024 RepID=UPI003222217A
MIDTINVVVHPAGGAPSVSYKIEHDQNLILAFGRPGGMHRALDMLDDPGSLLRQTFPHLAGLDPAVDLMHIELPDRPNDRGGFATSSCGLLLVPVPNGWVLVNPSGELRDGKRVGGAIPTVRAWGRPPANLHVAGGEFSLSEHQLAAVWLPSNLGKMHRIDLQRDGTRHSLSYLASSGLTGRPDYRLSERNKKALVFFFEEYLRWGSDPDFNPKPTGTARDRIRKLEADGQQVPLASWLRALWSANNKDQGRGPTAPQQVRDSDGAAIGGRSDTSADRIWFLPSNADKVTQLRSLEMALQWQLITKPEVDRILDEFEGADATLEQIVSDICSEFEHVLRQHIPASRFAASRADAQDEVDRLIGKIGRMIRFALTNRSFNPSRSPRDLPDLNGLSVQELHDRVHHGGSSPIHYQDSIERVEQMLEPDELQEWGQLRLTRLPTAGAVGLPDNPGLRDGFDFRGYAASAAAQASW